MPGSYIVAGARTPIGKLGGSLAGFSATDLGGFAITAALARAGIAPEAVEYVYMGQVLQAGAGQITARRAAVNAGIPMSTPASTINKVCLSGLNTIFLADQLISSGYADVVVAGGWIDSSWAITGTSPANTGAAAVPPKRLMSPAGGSSIETSTVICGSSAGKNPTKDA